MACIYYLYCQFLPLENDSQHCYRHISNAVLMVKANGFMVN